MTSVDPEFKADLECLSRIESIITEEEGEISTNLLPFLVKADNILARQRQH